MPGDRPNPDTGTRDGEILFLQPGYAHYRRALFARISQGANVLFLYVSAENEYPGAVRHDAYRWQLIPGRTGLRVVDVLLELFRIRPFRVATSVSYSPHTLAAWIYCSVMRRPLAVWIEEWIQPTRQNAGALKYAARIFLRFLGNRVLRNATAVIASGTAAAEFARKAGVHPERILKTIQSSEDLGQSGGMSPGPSDTSAFRILFLSRHIPSKALDVLMEAYAPLERTSPQVELLIGGEGPCTEDWKATAATLGLQRARFLGAIDPEHVPDTFRRASVFVLPACIRNDIGEPWGLVVNEALSMGLPVIVSDIVGAGFDLVVEGENGYVVPAGDVVALRDVIERLMRADLAAFAQASRRIFEARNSFEHMAATFHEAFRRMGSSTR